VGSYPSSPPAKLYKNETAKVYELMENDSRIQPAVVLVNGKPERHTEGA
jgi:hypothetical protein